MDRELFEARLAKIRHDLRGAAVLIVDDVPNNLE